MKRIERNAYNGLKKNVTNNTICCEIPTNWTHEARQAIHELLTIEKHMHAVRICPNIINHGPVVLYVRGQDANQENADINDVTGFLTVSCTTWNGYKVDNFIWNK